MKEDVSHELYGQFARIGKAVSNGHRIALLDLLGEGECSVESLANQAGLSIANTSQHLQQLRHVGLVNSRKVGQHVFYSLSEEQGILQLLDVVKWLAQRRLTEVGRLVGDTLVENTQHQPAVA